MLERRRRRLSVCAIFSVPVLVVAACRPGERRGGRGILRSPARGSRGRSGQTPCAAAPPGGTSCGRCPRRQPDARCGPPREPRSGSRLPPSSVFRPPPSVFGHSLSRPVAVLPFSLSFLARQRLCGSALLPTRAARLST